MTATLRFGVQFDATDPFWALVREAVHQHMQLLGINPVPIDVDTPYLYALPNDEQISLVEELLVQEIDALICQDWPEILATRLLDLGIPVVNLTELELRHPLFVAPQGLYDIAKDIGTFIAQRLNRQGRVLVIGGGVHHLGEDGRNCIAGVSDALRNYPQIAVQRFPSLWTYDLASQALRAFDWPPGQHFEAVFGLSDSIALAGSDVGRELGLIDAHSVVVGINGDPLALAAIVNGTLTATVHTSTTDLAKHAVDLAHAAARKEPLPANFRFKPTFVTADNVTEIAARKLVAMARLPSRLIGDHTRQAQQRLSQLETTLTINQQVGAVLDRRQLTHLVADLIRVSFGYDVVRLYLWNASTHTLEPELADAAQTELRLPLDSVGVLAEALKGSKPIFIPDAQHSHRFPPDPGLARHPLADERADPLCIKPVGLLDLHSYTGREHGRQELIGIQALADQLAIAMRNAELYSEAVQARAVAEKADQIKDAPTGQCQP